MRKQLLLFFLSTILSFYAFGQSSFYYDKGIYLVSGTSSPQSWARAYSDWTTGEQKGESLSAKMVIYCLLNDIGTPKNVNLALQKIEKWYKKDPDICYLGALLYFPDEYKYCVDFHTAYLNYYVDISPYNIKKYKVPQNITKSLKFVKYALENFMNNDRYRSPYCGIMGVCYEFGLGGMQQNYVEATRYYFRSVNRSGYIRDETAIKLVESSKNMTEFMNNVGTFIHRDDLPKYLIGVVLKKSDYEYLKVVIKKRDELFERFWCLTAEEKLEEYLDCSLDAQAMYDEGLKDKVGLYISNIAAIYGSTPFDALSSEKAMEYTKILSDYPNKLTAEKIKSTFQKYYVEKLERISQQNTSSADFINCMQQVDSFINIGLFSRPASYDSLKRVIPQKILSECNITCNEIVSFLNEYISSRKYDSEHPGYGEKDRNGYSFVYVGYIAKSDATALNLCEKLNHALHEYNNIDSIGFLNDNKVAAYRRFYNEYYTLVSAMGFCPVGNTYGYNPENENSGSYKKFIENFPSSNYLRYAKSRYNFLLIQEQNAAALKAALDLRSTSKRTEIKEVLAMPVTSSYAIIIEYLCKKKNIKKHEAYIAVGKEKQFLDAIDKVIKNIK